MQRRMGRRPGGRPRAAGVARTVIALASILLLGAAAVLLFLALTWSRAESEAARTARRDLQRLYTLEGELTSIVLLATQHALEDQDVGASTGMGEHRDEAVRLVEQLDDGSSQARRVARASQSLISEAASFVELSIAGAPPPVRASGAEDLAEEHRAARAAIDGLRGQYWQSLEETLASADDSTVLPGTLGFGALAAGSLGLGGVAVSLRRRARSARHEVDALGAAVRALDLTILEIDAGGTIRAVVHSSGALHMPAARAGSSLRELLADPDGQPGTAVLLAVRRGEWFEGRVSVMGDHGEAPAEIWVAPSDGGGSGRSIVALADGSERVERERQAEEFVGFVSHELRSPLTTVRAYASRLRRKVSAGDAPAGELVDALGEIEEASTRAADMIGMLVEFARLQRPFPLEIEPIDLQRTLEQEIAALSERSPEVSAELRAGQPGLVIATDGDRLRQVLSNLLDNAVKHAGTVPKISVELLANDAAALIRVRDNGPGIPPEQRDQLFQPYARGRTGATAGLGLGLYISRRIAERLGGSLELGDGGPGAEFVVSLPRKLEL